MRATQAEDEEEEEELDEFGVPVASASALATAAMAAPPLTGDPAAAAVVGTDQWVQCDRCRTWRIVPDAAWCGLCIDTLNSIIIV